MTLDPIKKITKKIICKLRRTLKGRKAVNSNLAYCVLSDNERPTFFGYHDKTPFSADGSRVLAMSIAASDTDPRSECTLMRLGYFLKQDNCCFSTDFIPFAETNIWCWQQGCMLQWHPIHANRRVVFNALVDGRYGSVVYDITQKAKVKEYNFPIYSLSPDGNYATSLNFSRLGRLRPGYGYGLLPDETKNEKSPTDEGLYLCNLQTGQRELIVSLQDLASSILAEAAQHYVNHATFSPDSQSIIFFHLWANEGVHSRGLRVCKFSLVSQKWKVIEDKRIVSHYCWNNKGTFLAANRDHCREWRYSHYSINDQDREDLELPFCQDGHPMFHPYNNNLFVTDTYPDIMREQHLYAVKIKEGRGVELATLYSPHKYRGQVRCDLHPRLDRNGDFLAVDAACYGVRRMIIFSLDGCLI